MEKHPRLDKMWEKLDLKSNTLIWRIGKKLKHTLLDNKEMESDHVMFTIVIKLCFTNVNIPTQLSKNMLVNNFMSFLIIKLNFS